MVDVVSIVAALRALMQNKGSTTRMTTTKKIEGGGNLQVDVKTTECIVDLKSGLYIPTQIISFKNN